MLGLVGLVLGVVLGLGVVRVSVIARRRGRDCGYLQTRATHALFRLGLWLSRKLGLRSGVGVGLVVGFSVSVKDRGSVSVRDKD